MSGRGALRPVLAALACVALPFASAGAAAPGAAPDNIVLFGGIGYIEEVGQGALFDLLTDETYRLEDATEGFVVRLNEAAGGLPRLSRYAIALDFADAERAVAMSEGIDRAPARATAELPKFFDRTLGLFFVGSFEEHFSTRFPFTGADGAVKHAYQDLFLASVSALVLDLETDEIVLSASALGTHSLRANDVPVEDEETIRANFVRAYGNAAELALERLARLVEDAPVTADRERHMITGVWIDGAEAQAVYAWRTPGRPRDMCRVPTGCHGAADCERLEGLLAHGATDMLSEAGLSTIPPLGWSEWRQDNAWEVSARFAIPQNRRSLTDRIRRINVDPRQARFKYVAALKDVGMQSTEVVPPVVTDSYVAKLYLIRAQTAVGQCAAEGGLQLIDDAAFFGVYESGRPRSHPVAATEHQRAFYAMAMMDALPKLTRGVRP